MFKKKQTIIASFDFPTRLPLSPADSAAPFSKHLKGLILLGKRVKAWKKILIPA